MPASGRRVSAMFSLILKGVGSFLHFYVGLRAAAAVPVQGYRLLAWLGLVVLVWLAYMTGLERRHGAAGGVAWLLGQFSLNWLAIMFMAAMCLLAVDLCTGFGLWLRRWSLLLRRAAIGAAAVLVTCAFYQGLRAPVVTAYEVRVAGLPQSLDGTLIAVLTDLHLGNQRGNDWMEARVEQVRALNPDLVVMVGDQVDSEMAEPEALGVVLRRLESPLGIWAVTGNHDFHGDLGENIKHFEAGGVKWLRDEVTMLAPGLYLAGIDDLGRAMRRGDGTAEAKVADVLRQAPSDAATIFLSHTPTAVEQAAESGAALMLSGHTHGGQIWPFGYLVQRVFPRMIGTHQIEDMTLIVSRGAGSWGPRMRLWHPGEILAVSLLAE